MSNPLTDAQKKFVVGLEVQNIDHGALQIVIAAMHVRNAHRSCGGIDWNDPGDVLVTVIDSVAG